MWPVDWIPAAVILGGWWVVYAIACGAAMGQRGYPPLDARLQGMTVLWVVGVPLSALVQRFSRVRAWMLLAYAFATGLVTAIFYGPIHAVIAAMLELMCRLTGRVGAKFLANGPVRIGGRVA